MPECEYYDDQHALPRNEELVRVRVELQEASARSYSSSESSSPQDPRYDPGLAVLTGSQNLIFRFNVEAPSEPQKTASSIMPMMTDKADEPPLAGEAPAEHQTAQDAPKPHDDAASSESSTTQVVHAKTLRSVEAQSDPIIASKQFASRTRADSMQAEASSSIQEKSPLRSGLASPLKLKTSDSGTAAPAGLRRESISSSPTLSKHTIHGAVEQNLAPFEPPSPSASSPQAERLPSIHQLTSTLTELAEAATQELPRQQAFSHNHRQSFGSANAQSPVLSNHPYPASVQTSPQAYFPPVMARSPTSTLGESPAYASPPAYPGFGPYSHRRPSMADGMPPMIPTLHSASSSGESGGGYHSSGTEGYSTNHTTPIDVGQVSENTPRPLLPPPPGMHALPPAPAPMMIQGLYKCDVPNCTAGTFQTQYLLNSHKNVHSQSRPHYCPVAGCSRAEGGKGFKRKNEMIRHGLVHNSPGYICPFCPEREHRYPRPDNLQRHVRVHHVDKDRDDEALRDVLNQRTEGQGKTRRRRTNTITTAVAAA